MDHIKQIYLSKLNGLWLDKSLPSERKFNAMIFIIEVVTHLFGPEKMMEISSDAELPFTIDDYYSIVQHNILSDYESYQPIIFYIERICSSHHVSATERLDILSFVATIISDLIPPEDVYFILTEAKIDLFYKRHFDIFRVYPHSDVIPKILTPLKVNS